LRQHHHKVVNNTLAKDGTPIAMQIVSAGPAIRMDGKKEKTGGMLTPNGGMITVLPRGTQFFTAASGKGSGGWCTGTINISCRAECE
jgi:hypothetical protein